MALVKCAEEDLVSALDILQVWNWVGISREYQLLAQRYNHGFISDTY